MRNNHLLIGVTAGVLLSLAALLLAGCGGAPPQPTATLTYSPQPPSPQPTAAPTRTPRPPTPKPTATPTQPPQLLAPKPTAAPTQPPQPPTVEPSGALQPLEAATCGSLADALGQALGVTMERAEAPFEDYISGQTGRGCRMTAGGTGLDFKDLATIVSALGEVFEARGWQADIEYEAAGPTGEAGAYRKGNALCLWEAMWEPSKEAKCPPDKPISACKLSPEQKLYRIAVNCAQSAAAAAPTPQPIRIRFKPGAISARIQGQLAAGEIKQYVLTAMGGQEMTVNLSATLASGSKGGAILAIWGADGTVLISDHAEATTWKGVLPSTQDYYIAVICTPQESASYTLEVVIPPAKEGGQFSDPFAYCAAVGTVDAPDERYVGPAVPDAIVKALREELGIAEEAPKEWIVKGTVWRCMDGKVWACFIGANIPCTAKANTSQTPTSEMVDFCKEHPTADVIPASVTGRETIYEWRCQDGAPKIVKQVFKPDARGFISDFWYEISPGDGS